MEFLTRKEVAKYFRVHERTVERWIRAGILKAYKLGDGKTALLRIPKSEINKFLERSKSKLQK
jgi:excisionase family DNA binding protein